MKRGLNLTFIIFLIITIILGTAKFFFKQDFIKITDTLSFNISWGFVISLIITILTLIITATERR